MFAGCRWRHARHPACQPVSAARVRLRRRCPHAMSSTSGKQSAGLSGWSAQKPSNMRTITSGSRPAWKLPSCCRMAGGGILECIAVSTTHHRGCWQLHCVAAKSGHRGGHWRARRRCLSSRAQQLVRPPGWLVGHGWRRHCLFRHQRAFGLAGLPEPDLPWNGVGLLQVWPAQAALKPLIWKHLCIRGRRRPVAPPEYS